MWLILYMEINPPFFYLTLTNYKKQLTKLYRNLSIRLHQFIFLGLNCHDFLFYFIFFIKKKLIRISLIGVSGNSKTVLRLLKKKKRPNVCVNWFCCDGVIVGWQDNSDFNGPI